MYIPTKQKQTDFIDDDFTENKKKQNLCYVGIQSTHSPLIQQKKYIYPVRIIWVKVWMNEWMKKKGHVSQHFHFLVVLVVVVVVVFVIADPSYTMITIIDDDDQWSEKKRRKKRKKPTIESQGYKQATKQTSKKTLKSRNIFFFFFLFPISIIIFGYGRMNRANPNQQNEEKKETNKIYIVCRKCQLTFQMMMIMINWL